MRANFNSLRRICAESVAEGVVPGLVVLVGRAGHTLFHEAFGAAAPDTVYDLASLTKALCTSVLAMRAIDAGRLHLEDCVGQIVPAWRGEAKDTVTVRQLLAHAGGLPAHQPLYERARSREDVVRLAAEEPLVCTPGARSLYSDLGFIVLGDLLERTCGARLDVLAHNEIAAPVGDKAPGFLPAGQTAPPWLAGRAPAATELCAARGRLIAGEVHDLNAAAMGGVAGHAGLFGCAQEIAAVTRALCLAWRGAGALVSRDVVREFWKPAGIPGSNWRLGWDGPAAAGSQAGDVISRAAAGHLGFTGCSLWIDPEHEVFVVVLSNRIHPTVRDDARFRTLRPAINDAALRDAGYG